jgi:hypothetical protein
MIWLAGVVATGDDIAMRFQVDHATRWRGASSARGLARDAEACERVDGSDLAAALIASEVGPSASTAMPTIDGVSSPGGIAVMSARPVRARGAPGW